MKPLYNYIKLYILHVCICVLNMPKFRLGLHRNPVGGIQFNPGSIRGGGTPVHVVGFYLLFPRGKRLGGVTSSGLGPHYSDRQLGIG